MPSYQANGGVVRGALLANAAFSFACALGAALRSDPLAEALFTIETIVFDKSAPRALFELGIMLALFAALVAFAGTRERVSRATVRAIIIGDLLWVIGSAGVLILAPDVLTGTGVWVVGLIAFGVLVFALAQGIGLTVLYQGESEVMMERKRSVRHIRLARNVCAPAAVAWGIMTDHEAYAEVADNLVRVEVLKGEAKGLHRKCTGKKGESWTEYAHIWEEGERYGFIVNTDAPGYPYPLATLSAVWAVEETDPNTSIVSIAFEVAPLRTLKGAIFIRASMVMFPILVDRLLGKWKARMEEQQA